MFKMTDKKYQMMLIRRKFCKRMILVALAFGLSFHVAVLLFGDIRTPRIMKLTNLETCPACYGISVCPELYSNQIILETPGWSSLFNAKNVYYAYTRYNRRAVLKKLAHDWELRDLDVKLCQVWGLESNCKPNILFNLTTLFKKIEKIVMYNLTHAEETAPRRGLVMCPYPYSFFQLVGLLLDNNHNEFDLMYLWTMLMVNPEPIILQLLPKSEGWRVPAYGGVCGRVELVAYEGEPLSSLMHVEWHRKLKFAKGILEAAMDFTYKHDRFRFYLMDWSMDNIVANENDYITFVDLEDVIVIDKHTSPGSELQHWYQRHSRENQPGFAFSIQKMCQHHLSDHNIWAACYVLAGEETPLLYPIPKHINDSRPHLNSLLYACLNGENRFHTVISLQHVINDMLTEKYVVGNAGDTKLKS